MSALNHPKGVHLGSGQDSVNASQVDPHSTQSSMSLWSLLCEAVHTGHVLIEGGRSKLSPQGGAHGIVQNAQSSFH